MIKQNQLQVRSETQLSVLMDVNRRKIFIRYFFTKFNVTAVFKNCIRIRIWIRVQARGPYIADSCISESRVNNTDVKTFNFFKIKICVYAGLGPAMRFEDPIPWVPITSLGEQQFLIASLAEPA